MTTCQFILFDAAKRDGGWPRCGRPATHTWTPRPLPWHKPEAMPVCREHGEGLAGNWRDELKETA